MQTKNYLIFLTLLVLVLTACSPTRDPPQPTVPVTPPVVSTGILPTLTIKPLTGNAPPPKGPVPTSSPISGPIGEQVAACLAHTTDNANCKDCCDCLDIDAETRKVCRDSCAVNDFSRNTDFLKVNVISLLGPKGDYSTCTATGNEQACKQCCDSPSAYSCGDRRFCRDACAAH
jgi:hypothetical protein